MLTTLTVDNYALINHLDVAFDAHLNIITGETGAGKSILMGALSLLLGGKGDAAAIKDPSRNCVVEASFDISQLGLESLFDELDIDYEPQTIIRRQISAGGKSRAFVNDTPVQLATLKTLGQHLIDIHSQHQNLILSSKTFRITALDTVADCSDVARAYGEAFAALGRYRAELAAAESETAKSHDEEEWLRHQATELVAASLRSGECEELEAELRTLENADSIGETLALLHERLDNDQTGILPMLKESVVALRHIASSYASAEMLAERLQSVAIELKDIDSTVETDAERIDSDPERLAKVGERLDTLYTLCRKHRVETEAELIEIRDRYVAQLEAIEHSDANLAELRNKVEEADKLAHSLADALHAKRSKAAPALAGEVAAILKEVGMVDAQFEITLTPTSLNATGGDNVDFTFSANKGLAPQPIERIASGGELSRVMLALKAVLAKRLALPTIIFDEIDTGVSGRVANAMGEIINALAESMQVINITHLPQVASKGRCHLLVYKSEGATHLRTLSVEERVEEIAKMLSGDKITDAAISQAKHLLSI